MSKIMIVDDEPPILILLKVILGKEGYEMVGANSGKECLKKLKNEKPDLILLDVMMPGEDGWEVCREIKSDEKTKNIPLAMFTVKGSDGSVRKSHECGADAHINKPFEMEELLEEVKRLLGKAGSS